VEAHSPKQVYDFAPDPTEGACQWVWGGKCWPDGSSLAFEKFERYFDRPDYIKAELKEWHDDRFGKNTVSE
jgi:hypothetical protein